MSFSFGVRLRQSQRNGPNRPLPLYGTGWSFPEEFRWPISAAVVHSDASNPLRGARESRGFIRCSPWAINGALCGEDESTEKAFWGHPSFGGRQIAARGVRLVPSESSQKMRTWECANGLDDPQV
jgi:hypothetical protein